MTMKNFAFFIGLGTLFTHELDAIPNHEWRVLPLLRLLPDDLGLVVFVIAHVPIFAVLVAMVASTNERTRNLSRLAISGFLVLHGVAHLLYMDHPDYEFSSVLSQSLIFGGAVFGTIYLVLEAWSKRETGN